MALKVLIVESPVKQRIIQQFLTKQNDTWLVLASKGHIFELQGFSDHFTEPFWKASDPLKISALTQGVAQADEIYIGTDLDREGESIAWHIGSIILQAFPEKPIFRVRYNQVTQNALIKALNDPENFDWNLNEAQITRSITDRTFGFAFSKLIQTVFRCRNLSVGRVQSAILRLIATRDLKRKKFKAVKLFRVVGQLTDGAVIISRTFKKEKNASLLLANIKDIELKVVTHKKELLPPQPFNTSSLLQQLAARYGLATQQANKLLQHLFQSGIITYLRTSATGLNPAFAVSVGNYIESTLPGYSIKPPRYLLKKVSPHEAIRPTSIYRMPSDFYGTSLEQKIYQLIWTRTLVSQTKAIRLKEQQVQGMLKGKQVLTATGGQLQFDGWLKTGMGLFGSVPKPISETATLDFSTFKIMESQTTPPSLWNEATLIKTLEQKGLGQPSTYGYVIKRLTSVGYVKKGAGLTLETTAKGHVVLNFLKAHLKFITSSKTTANLERLLDTVSIGREKRSEVLRQTFEIVRLKKKSCKIQEVVCATKRCDHCKKESLILVLSAQSKQPIAQCTICQSEYYLKERDGYKKEN